MARAKRANHRSGSEEQDWTAEGTGEQPDQAGWAGAPPDHHANGTNGHSGPVSQIGPNGLQAHDFSNHPGTPANGRSGPPAESEGTADAAGRGDGVRPVEDAEHGAPALDAEADAKAEHGDGAVPDKNVKRLEGVGPGQSAASGERTERRASSPAAVGPASGSESSGDVESDVRSGSAASGGLGANSKPNDSEADAEVASSGVSGVDGSGGSTGSGAETGSAVDASEAQAAAAPEWLEEAAAREQARLRAQAQAQAAGFGTPVRVDEIAVAAMALSEDLLAATKDLPESVESRQFRRELDDAADTFRAVASELESTAGHLVRLAASEGQSCGVTWGVCPEHGLTLMGVGEVVTCRVLGCHRQHEGVVERCTQPVAYKVVDVAGPALFACAGHAIACRLHLDGAVITLATDSLELL